MALKLVVEDDGVGIPRAALGEGSRSGQFGLAGMRERARMIDAHLIIKAPPGGGTQVVLEFSLE